MTPEQLRKIDALVAEHIFEKVVYFSDGEFVKADGTPIHDYRMRDKKGSYREFTPHYSTDIAAAWEIVEKLHGQSFRIETGSDGVNRYRCFSYYKDTNISVRATTAPLAICLLALKVMGIDIEQELALGELVAEGQERRHYE
jgi:hypothetical protein